MALSTQDIRHGSGTAALADPAEQLARLKKQVDAAEMQQRIESRGPAIEQLAEFQRRRKAAAEQEEAGRAAWKLAEKAQETARLAYARTIEQRANETAKLAGLELDLKKQLSDTAPAGIHEAVAALEAQIADALTGQQTRHVNVDGRDVVKSNVVSVHAFLAPARFAVGQLMDLRYTALSEADAKKKIAAILKSIPRLDLELRTVKTPPLREFSPEHEVEFKRFCL